MDTPLTEKEALRLAIAALNTIPNQQLGYGTLAGYSNTYELIPALEAALKTDEQKPISAGSMNKSRALWASVALRAFCKETGQSANTEAAGAISDLICDLMHLATETGFNIDELIEQAKNNYISDRVEDE